MMGKRHWLGAVSVAIATHLGIATAWISLSDSEGALAEGQDGLQVSVGLAGSFTESTLVRDEAVESPDNESKSPATASEEADLKAAEPSPAQKAKPESKPEPEPAPKPEPEQKRKPKPDPRPEPKPEQKPKPEPKPEPELMSDSHSAKQAEASSTTKPASELDKANSSVATQATGSGDRVETGGNPAAKQSYLLKVLNRIARHKRYPRSARRDGVTGVVQVRFTIEPNGSVKNIQLITTSGDSRLDKEAQDMLLRATPPSIPRELGKSSLDLTLPIEFKLNPTRKLF